MDIQQLKYFLAVVHTGSYTKAAGQLYISRQAVRQSVRLLEEELQTTLFLNGKKNLQLTPFGITFSEETEKLVSAFDSFESVMKMRAASQQLLLRVKTGAAVMMHLKPDRFVQFQNNHPHVLLSVSESSNQEIFQDLKDDRVDVGLIGTSAKYLKGFTYTLLIKNDLCICCNKANPLAEKEYLTFEDLKGQPIVGHGEGYDLQRFYIEKCAEAGFEPCFSVISSDPQIAIRLVEQNRSICFGISEYMKADAESQMRSSARVLPLRLEEKDEWGIYAVTRGGKKRNSLQELFIDCIRGSGS
ncbi:MAG: LysR family transcriptional regulator [Lachnospiraceae bacterium]|nr:LysR family transcriptional regulator [Lachnospiraceae bacterium]